MRTDELINLIAEDAAPRRPLKMIFALLAGLGVLVALAIFVFRIGPRPDFAAAAETPRFLFKFVVTGLLAIGALGAALKSGMPGAPARGWLAILVLAPVLLLGGAAIELAVLPRDLWLASLVGHNARFCLTLIPLMAIGPLVCLLIALRQGAPTRPALTGALAGLAASGIAATLYAANCNDDSPLFVAAWYPISTFLMVALGALIGRFMLRW